MPMQSLRNIENNTPATATDIQWNYGTIESFVNNNLLNIDGSIPMTGQLTLAGNPLTALHAVTKQYVDAIQPVGMIVDFAGAAAPSGWLLCNGAIVDQVSYPALYAVCGSTYNTGGEGGTQFRLPDFTDRSSIGRGTNAVGVTGGTADAVVVSHSHTASGGSHSHTSAAHTHSISSHNHTSAAHTHSINHNHGSASTGNQSASHTHHAGSPVVAMYGGGSLGFGTNKPLGIPLNIVNGTELLGNQTASHTHSFNMPNFTGTSGSTTPGSTGGKSLTSNSTTPGSTGSVDVTPTISTEGVTGTDLNYHPFLAVNKIIKAG